MVGRCSRPEQQRERRQLAVRCLVSRQCLAGHAGGVDDGIGRPGDVCRGVGGAQEAHVERGVVRDEDRATGELGKARHDAGDARRRCDHRVGDAGEDRDERRDRLAGVDERLELSDDLPPADLDGADLRDRAGGGAPASRLQVDDDERDLAQRCAELVERALNGHRQRGHVRRP